jgi:hypothetical protein
MKGAPELLVWPRSLRSSPEERATVMPVKLGLLTLAAMAVVTVASLGPTSAQPRFIPAVQTQGAGDAEEVGYRYRYRYRPYYRRYAYRPYYRPYGYRCPNLETCAVWYSLRPTWFH